MVIDLFGLSAEQVQDRYPEVYQHVVRTVKVARQAVLDRSGTRDAQEYLDKWWVFGKPRSELRPALAGLTRYITTVETAKHRVFQFLDAAILPDNKLLVIATEDAAHLAVLSSSLHVMWALRAGGWLGVGNDPVYVKSRCFDPFPFPAWSEDQCAGLATAGERLDAFRKARMAENPNLTLTRLYNALEAHRSGAAMTNQEAEDFAAASVLVLAELHAEIDALTLAAYGFAADLTVERVLTALAALNAERAAEEARGEVRWLRPAYQRARFAKTTTAGPKSGDLIGEAEPVAEPIAWPKEIRGQVLAIKGVLADTTAPLAVETLAAQFKGRKIAPDIARLVGVLQRDGQVRRDADGRYSLLRSA
jgi:hypothetical protein